MLNTNNDHNLYLVFLKKDSRHCASERAIFTAIAASLFHDGHNPASRVHSTGTDLYSSPIYFQYLLNERMSVERRVKKSIANIQ